VNAAAAKIFCNPSVKTPAAPARVLSKNVRRVIAPKICCRDQRSTIQLSTDFESDVPLKNIEKHLERLQTVFVSDVADGHSL